MASTDAPNPFGPLPCSAIVYRALRARGWIDQQNNRIAPAAFLRRLQDTDGLSVHLAAACKAEEVGSNLKVCYGAVSLHTGRIRDIGLDVEQDRVDHANITGAPYPTDNMVEAERLAGLLAGQVRVLWLRGG